MSKFADRAFWVDTSDRAVSTFAQTVVGAISADVINIVDLDFGQMAGVGGLAALISVLQAVAARGKPSE